MIDPRAGLGPLYYLCPDCKGSGGRTVEGPLLVGRDYPADGARRTSGNEACGRCHGKGIVLEDRSR